VAGVAGNLATRRGGSDGAALPPVIAAALLVFPLGWNLYTGMGTVALTGISVLVALVLTGALPALADASPRGRLALASAGAFAMLAGAGVASALPKFTVDEPLPVSLSLYLDGDRDVSGWLAASGDAPLPRSLALAGDFKAKPGHPYPWAPSYTAWGAPGPRVKLPPPELVVASVTRAIDGLHVHGLLRSARGASIGAVYVPGARLVSARLQGVDVPLPPTRSRGDWQGVEDVTLPAGGVDVELVLTGADPFDAYVVDTLLGLDDAGRALSRARPPWAVPIGRGDRVVVSRLQHVTP
jgi:hypothetical protein